MGAGIEPVGHDSDVDHPEALGLQILDKSAESTATAAGGANGRSDRERRQKQRQEKKWILP